MSTSYKVLDVYISGYPNYFIHGVDTVDLSTYVLVNNNTWVKTSTDFTQADLNRLHHIDTGNFYVHG